jgi:hypothetical protein
MRNQTLTAHGERTGAAEDKNESPFIFEFFLVEGTHFKCMAYQDGTGKWRGAFNHLELPGSIRILA